MSACRCGCPIPAGSTGSTLPAWRRSPIPAGSKERRWTSPPCCRGRRTRRRCGARPNGCTASGNASATRRGGWTPGASTRTTWSRSTCADGRGRPAATRCWCSTTTARRPRKGSATAASAPSSPRAGTPASWRAARSGPRNTPMPAACRRSRRGGTATARCSTRSAAPWSMRRSTCSFCAIGGRSATACAPTWPTGRRRPRMPSPSTRWPGASPCSAPTSRCRATSSA